MKIIARVQLLLVLLLLTGLKASAVKIDSFKPRIGVPGTLVTIKGTDLKNPTNFTIGGTAAIILSNTDSVIVAMVMPGAQSGSISLTNVHGTAVSLTNFMLVVAPVVSGVQPSKLTANDNNGIAAQGTNVAISADGYTVMVGGNQDNSGIGAAWIYIPGASSWKQQGHKLVGKDSVGQSKQGTAIAISANGNTAIVGGPGDNNGKGAVWVFTRKDSVWRQQGSKLTITGTLGSSPALFGASVSLSADGNTLVAEAGGDNDNIGAAYVFVRKDTTWVQLGVKLVATSSAADNTSTPGDQRVAMSADGNTFAMGAHSVNNGLGGVWVFTRTDTVWTQQGGRLFGSTSIGQPKQGSAVAISADGSKIAIGGPGDDSSKGAVWVFARSGTGWVQQGIKIKSTYFAASAAQQGSSVNLNADGKVLLIGAKADASLTGAGAIFRYRDTTWKQYSKTIAQGAAAGSTVGNSTGLSAEGIWAILGGAGDSAGQGAAWVAGYGSGLGGAGTCNTPKTITLAATHVLPTTAILNGTVDATGLFPTTVVFEYGTSAGLSNASVGSLTTGISPIEDTTGVITYTSNITHLLPATTYYFRIVAANYCTEITDGNIMSFTTPDTAALPHDTTLVSRVIVPGSGLSPETIPTAFSPNNDGINDTWEVPFLSKYAKCSVKVFNRSGQIVFASTGYSNAWDGRYKSNALPSGAYFYMIDLKNNQQVISGSVNLIK
jgi:gliding motility-associated-like protein